MNCIRWKLYLNKAVKTPGGTDRWATAGPLSGQLAWTAAPCATKLQDTRSICAGGGVSFDPERATSLPFTGKAPEQRGLGELPRNCQ